MGFLEFLVASAFGVVAIVILVYIAGKAIDSMTQDPWQK